METPIPSLNKWQIWLLAARPKTLPAAASPAIVGSAVAFSLGKFQLGPALAALMGALLLQIGANIANDVFDFKRGADTEARLGPLRVTQAGLLTPAEVKRGMWVVFGVATLLGIYLAAVAGWLVVLLGLAAIAAAIAYTAGPFPLGYNGLGEVFVFIFFGLVAECGTVFVQAKEVPRLAWWSAIPMGLLIVNILVVNNLRDIETDRSAGKKTLIVRLGVKGARAEYMLCLLVSYAVPLVVVLLGAGSAWLLLSWLSIPAALPLVRSVFNDKGRPLNNTLAGSGRLVLVYGLFYSLGLVVASLIR
jgi:1,4-dihydroxy-2-naphthoate polyprenyltransferase